MIPTAHSLQERFPAEFVILESLFGHEQVREASVRLHEIHCHCERIWEEYARGLPGGVVRYLLVAEAPPWSLKGPPQYLLDPASRPRTLMSALRGAFLLRGASSASETLAELSRRGFLLVDSIPFSMDYSRRRASPGYQKLIDITAQTYLQLKLSHPLLSWDSHVRVALCFKLNGEAVINALDGSVKLGALDRSIGVANIVANSAGYPDFKRLRAVYCLD